MITRSEVFAEHVCAAIRMRDFQRAGRSAVEREAGVRESAFGSLKCFAVRGQAFKE
jgi:hypothetical protein